MKRSEMEKNIIGRLYLLSVQNSTKYDYTLWANEILKMIEEAGMMPPKAIVDDGQGGKYKDYEWEPEDGE